MILDVITKTPYEEKYVHQNEDTYLVSQKVAKNGTLQNVKAVYQVVNPAKENKDFVSTDFDISNLLEVGSYGLLKPTYLSNMSDMAFADKFQNMNITGDE